MVLSRQEYSFCFRIVLEFHMLANPKNCEIIVLGHDGLGRLKLDGRCEPELSCRHAVDENGGGESDEHQTDVQSSTSSNAKIARTPVTTTAVTGYKSHSRLRTIPPQWVYPRSVRMCYNDT